MLSLRFWKPCVSKIISLNKPSSDLFISHPFLSVTGIPDPTGQIAANMTQTYLGGAEMGNLTSMTPGMVDVRKHFCLFDWLF